MSKIGSMSPQSGRLYKENDQVINIADILASIYSLDGNIKVKSNAGKSVANITRPNNTTAYLAGQVCGQNPASVLTFENILPTPGAYFILVSLSLRIEVSSIPSGMTGFKLHLFDSMPTPLVDGAAFNVIAADKDKYLGYVLTDNVEDIGDELYIRMNNIGFIDKLAEGSTTLYGQLSTISGYTPSANAVKVIKTRFVGV